MTAIDFIKQYTQLCEKKGIAPQVTMLSELERAGHLPPQEEFYPATTITDELELYRRIAEHGEQINAPAQTDRARRITTIILNIKEIIQSTAQLSKLQSALQALDAAGYKRISKFSTGAVYSALQDQFTVVVQPLKGQLAGISDSMRNTIKIFLQDENVQKAFEQSKILQQRSEIAKQICKYGALAQQFRRVCSAKLQDVQVPTEIFEPAQFKVFVTQVQTKIKEDEVDASKYFNQKFERLSPETLYDLTYTIVTCSQIFKLEGPNSILKQNQTKLTQLVANRVEFSQKAFEKIPESTEDCLALAKIYRQFGIEADSYRMLFTQLIPSDSIKSGIELTFTKRETVMKNINNYISSLQFKQTPTLFYDDLSKQLIASVLNDINNVFECVDIIKEYANDFRPTIQTIFESYRTFRSVACEYNLILFKVKQNQIYLRKHAESLEADIKKSMSASSIAALDDANAQRLQKVSKFAWNQITLYIQKMLKLDVFEKKCEALVKQLEMASIQNTLQFCTPIKQLKQEILAFCQQEESSIEIFVGQYQHQICRIILQKLLQGRIVIEQFSIKLALDSNMQFQPSLEAIENTIDKNSVSYLDLCKNPEFCLSQSDQVKIMFEQLYSSLKKQIKLVDSKQLVNNLQQFQTKVSEQCEIVQLASTRSDSYYSKKYSTVEQCIELFNSYSKFLAVNLQPESHILQLLNYEVRSITPFVLFTQVGTSTLEINLNAVLQQMQAIPLSIIQVSVGACCFICQGLVQQLQLDIQAFNQKVEIELKEATTGQQIAGVLTFFNEFKLKLEGDLNQRYQKLVLMRPIVTQQYNLREQVCKEIDQTTQSFVLVKDKVRNIGSILDSKKKSMLDNFKKELHGENGIVLRSVLYKQKIENFMTKLLDRVQTALKMNEKTDMFSPSYFTTVESELKEMISVLAQSKEMLLLYDSFIGESKSLFTDPILTSADENKIAVLKQSASKAETEIQGLRGMFSFQQKIQILIQMEWGLLKSRLDIFEELLTELKQLEKSEFQVASINLLTCATTTIKMLKSPALQREHWCDLSSKVNFSQTALKFQIQLVPSKLPEMITGQILLYSILSVCNDQKSFQAFISIVKQTVVRAENELSVRQAIEEIQNWLRSDTQLVFAPQELSKVSFEETMDVFNQQFIPLHCSWKQILVLLNEKKAVITSIKTNPYADSVKQQINEAETSIEALIKLAIIINQLSKQVSVLEPVMGRRVLPNEHKKFYSALKVLCFIMTEQLKHEEINTHSIPIQLMLVLQLDIPDVMKLQLQKSRQQDYQQLGQYQFVIQQFEAIQQQFFDVQLALRQYLEQKRLSFPRFYFISDADVLQILANANTKPEETINPHSKKLFSSMDKLHFDGNNVVGFQSSEGESVMLNQKLIINQNIPPELWLKRFDLAVKQTIKQEVLNLLQISEYKPENVEKMQIDDNFDVNKSYQRVKTQISPLLPNSTEFYTISDINKSLQQKELKQNSGEALVLMYCVQYTAMIDYAMFASQETEKFLNQALDRHNKLRAQFTQQLYLPEISSASFGTGEYVMQAKLKMLATHITHFIQVLTKMISSPLDRAWIWNREMKARVHRSGDLYFVSLDTFIPYTYEYQGLLTPLIHTPLTDRCFSTLVSAISVEKSSNPQGPAGTGKTETVKTFSNRIGRPCIVFNCDSAIDREDLSRILAGIVLSGSVGCFDEINRLSPAVLSAISIDIEHIQQAIAARINNIAQDEFLILADIRIPIPKISPFAAVFVTMNPASREYRGRSELPFSLTRVLRGCFMGRADIQQIMETVLETSGFSGASILATKADLVYQLATRRIPKEVHLDWGLRSLQGVLRQAAVQRAGIVKNGIVKTEETGKMETQVVIKALEDATFSRVQGKSTQIFTEILIDVFGEQQKIQVSKYGAVSAAEQLIAENVMSSDRNGQLVVQLYRTMVNKLGVALLGRSATGKTTIRRLLKEAIQKATKNKIQIIEYVIAPKSMSRQDLLGYVDPNTKEWVDGALTRQARLAVQNITQKESLIWPWIVFDGSVESTWIEALNSSLDDNRLLSLSSGERIRFPVQMDPIEQFIQLKGLNVPMPVSFIFETDSLQAASPATVSRLGVILVGDLSFEQQLSEIKEPLIQQLKDDLKKVDLLYLSCITTHISMALPFSKNILIQNQQQLDQTSIQNLTTHLIGSCQHSLIIGPKQSGKYFIIKKALESNKESSLITISCSSLTTRDDIIRALLAECTEQQSSDNLRTLRPKKSQKLVICLRNCDVVPFDEYGHSQIFCFLWSIFAHQRVYLKCGSFAMLQNICFIITVTDQSKVPIRLQRLMCLIKMKSHDNPGQLFDKCTPFFQILKSAKLIQQVQQQVSTHETLKVRVLSHSNDNQIVLPQILSEQLSPSFEILNQINSLQLDQNQIVSIADLILSCEMCYSETKLLVFEEIQKNLKQKMLISFEDSQTPKIAKKLVSGLEYSRNKQQLKFISVNEKKMMVQDIIMAIVSDIPGMVMYQQLFAKLDEGMLNDHLKIISSIQFSLILTQGCVFLAQPGYFAAEQLFIAATALILEVKFISNDSFSNQFIKQVAEKIANKQKLCIIVDSSSINRDNDWLLFCNAVASKDASFFTSKLNITDVKNLTALFVEKQNFEGSDHDATQAFLQQILESIYIVLLLSPECIQTDSILTDNPPIRRRYSRVSMPISNISSQNVKQQIQLLKPAIQEKEVLNIIESVQNQQKKMQKVVYMSHYHQILNLQTIFKLYWQSQLESQQDSLQQGLAQLSQAQKEVDTLSKQAKERQITITQAQTDANQALIQITEKMESVTQSKVQAAQLEKELKSKEITIKQQRDEAEKELSQVQPIIDEAKRAVSEIPSDAITEMRTFQSPPPAVALVLEAVVRLLGMQDSSWRGMRAFLSQNGVMRQIVGLDITRIQPATIVAVKAHIEKNPAAFDQPQIQRVSRAAAPLAAWAKANIQYLEIFSKVQPLMQAADEANARLGSLRSELAKLDTRTKALEEEAASLKRLFEQKNTDLTRFQSELHIIEDKKAKGEHLLQSLSSERQRWAQNEQIISQQMNAIEKSSLQAASMFVLCGQLNDDQRSANFDRKSFQSQLYNQLFVDQVVKMGLRSSSVSLENASLLDHYDNHAFQAFALSYVTESTGVINYLKSKIKGLQLISATADNLSNLLAIAARFGQSIAITDCDQGTIPHAIIPYLRYSSCCYKLSDNSTSQDEVYGGINMALLQPNATMLCSITSQKVSEVNPKFRMFIISSVKIRIDPTCVSKVIELSFASTQKSREDLYLDEVLKQWSPATLEKITMFQSKETELRVQQKNVELMLLEALKSAQKSKNILDDENLVVVLERARQQQTEIDDAQRQIAQSMQELNQLKAQAYQIAVVVGNCQHAMDLIAQVNPLYISDDSSITPILRNLLVMELERTKDKTKISSQMVTNVIENLSITMKQRIQNTVFSPDKIGSLVTFLLSVRGDVFTYKMLEFVTGQYNPTPQVQTPVWLDPAKKSVISAFMDVIGPTETKLLDLVNESWKLVIENVMKCKELNEAQLPTMSPTAKALFIIALRPDLLSQALSQLVDFIFPQQNAHDPLRNAIELASGMTQPIIIYTSYGQDPTNTLVSRNVSLTPGKENDADDQILLFLDEFGVLLEKQSKNYIIVVKGAHLCQNWLESLPSKLYQYSSAYCNKYQVDFGQHVKLVLLLEPRLTFPAGLSRISWRICLQQQVSPKQTMLQILRDSVTSKSKKPEMNKLFNALLYCIAAAHTIIECRKQFQPRGIASDPGWSQMEALTLTQILAKIVSYDDCGVKDTVSKAIGLAVDAVYGVQTKDGSDLQLLRQIIRLSLSGAVLQKAVQCIKGEKIQSTDPQTNCVCLGPDFAVILKRFPAAALCVPPFEFINDGDFVLKASDYVSKFFPERVSAADVLLKPAALLIRNEKDSLQTLSILQKICSVQQQESADQFAALKALKAEFDVRYQKADLNRSVTASNPIQEEIALQIASLVSNVKHIKHELDGAVAQAADPLTASEKVKQLAQQLSQKITPEDWISNISAPPTSYQPIGQPLLVVVTAGSPSLFVGFVFDCLQQLSAASQSTKNMIDLSLTARPQALVEAVRRHAGRLSKKPLDNVRLYITTSNGGGAVAILKGVVIEGYDFKQQNLEANFSKLDEVFVCEGEPPANGSIPFYVDRNRELRMSVAEQIAVEIGAEDAEIFGVYAHLEGR